MTPSGGDFIFFTCKSENMSTTNRLCRGIVLALSMPHLPRTVSKVTSQCHCLDLPATGRRACPKQQTNASTMSPGWQAALTQKVSARLNTNEHAPFLRLFSASKAAFNAGSACEKLQCSGKAQSEAILASACVMLRATSESTSCMS